MFSEPSFLIQVGHGGRVRVQLANDNDHLDGAILSPSDYSEERNNDIKNALLSNGKYVLFDPQMYVPDQDHREDMKDHQYYRGFLGSDYDEGNFYDKDYRKEFCELVVQAQEKFDVDAFLSPSPVLEMLDADRVNFWYDLTESFISVAEEEGEDIPIYASLPVNGMQLNDSDRFDILLNTATELDTDGFYVSTEYSDSDMRLPLKGKSNIKSLLDLFKVLKSNRYDVIAGSTHQISHLLYTVGVDAVASGHYKNLKNLGTDRWVENDGIRRTVIRYYSDKLLDTVRPDGLLEELDNADFDMDLIQTGSPYDSGLFDNTTTPSQSGWAQREGDWEHYLWSMHTISTKYTGLDLDERRDQARETVARAQSIYRQIETTASDNTEEIDDQFYEDWLEVIDDLENDKKFERVKRVV